MTASEQSQFLFFYLFLLAWICMSVWGLLFPEHLLGTHWGKTAWKSIGAFQVRITHGFFLLAGIAFLIFSLLQLGKGTFRWRGNPKTYGFSDFRR